MRLETILIRVGLSILVGLIIGVERSIHGRAAGMRTHVLVCLGSAMTSMTGIYVYEVYGIGDVLRLAAQVISGVGFLGAGMIILKNDNMITGLTTAAGVWATATVGIALGYGFYTGALIIAAGLMFSLILLAKMERRKKNTKVVYLEIDDMKKINALMDIIREKATKEPLFRILPPKSNCNGHLGLELVMDRRQSLSLEELLSLDNVIFAAEN